MYVAVKGGEKAIRNAHRLLAKERRGDPDIAEISVPQIDGQLSLAVDRVMTEGSLYDRSLAALAIKQSRGDLIEAIFLVRAYRTTLPRFGGSEPIETGSMTVRRRISASFKDVPGGQLLGPTFDYTHRLIDFGLAAESECPAAELAPGPAETTVPSIASILGNEGLVETETDHNPSQPPGDVTSDALDFPAGRDLRLQALARGDEGFLLALGYSTQRGYARNHAFAGEIRVGTVTVEMFVEELGFTIAIGEITVTEVQMINQFKGSTTVPPQFTRGYGLSFGHCERKAMSMALVDRALRCRELDEDNVGAPAQDEEFVLSHCDNVQATGFVEHLKLPHYVDFQSELELVRRMRREVTERAGAQEAAE